MGEADRRSTDLVGGHDPASGHPYLPGLTGPRGRPHGATGEGSDQRIPREGRRPGPSVDVDGDVRHTAPRRAATDPEEVRLVQVDDTGGVLRTVVGHRPLDAAAATTDDHD